LRVVALYASGQVSLFRGDLQVGLKELERAIELYFYSSSSSKGRRRSPGKPGP
jgi:hypothetical protein